MSDSNLSEDDLDSELGRRILPLKSIIDNPIFTMKEDNRLISSRTLCKILLYAFVQYVL
jgi:hypothetical protein